MTTTTEMEYTYECCKCEKRFFTEWKECPACGGEVLYSPLSKEEIKTKNFTQLIDAGYRLFRVDRYKYQIKESEHKDLLKIDMKVQKEQIKFLKKIRSERNNDAVKQNLEALKKAAEGSDNLMPFILEAVKVYASIGEICNTMRTVFGEYKEHVVI